MGFCCFVTIKDQPLGFLLNQNFYWLDPPLGGLGGRSPPNVSTPFLPGSEKKGKLLQKVPLNLLKIGQQVA